jgi:hypothetical protein
MTLTFSSSGSNTYKCGFDTTTLTACTSPKTYGSVGTPLPEGSHTFQAQAIDNKNAASSIANYSWVVDRTAPTVSSISRVGATPTSAASVSWTVTFSEPVLNVAQAQFALVAAGGLGGTAAITAFSGSGATYTVTASTGSGSGTLGLNLNSKGTAPNQIKDAAGNVLSTTVPYTGAVYALDRTPPPAPTITSGPSGTGNPSSATFNFSDTEAGVTFLCKLDAGSYAACSNPATFSGLTDGSHTLSVQAKDAAGNISTTAASRTWSVDATGPPKPTILGPNNKSDSTAATFTITDTEAGVTFQCSLDGSPYTACTSPKTYTLLSSGTHVFDARAVDAAGNIGDFNEWKWTINGFASGGQPFTISGNAVGALYPGGVIRYVDLALTNPNSVTIYITSLTVGMQPITAPNANPTHPCSTSLDFALTQFGGGFPVVLPPGTKTLSQLGYTQSQMPSITMLNRPVNQDGCKSATLHIAYTGSGQS